MRKPAKKRRKPAQPSVWGITLAVIVALLVMTAVAALLVLVVWLAGPKPSTDPYIIPPISY